MKVDTTYEPYSNDPDYIAANRSLIADIELDDVVRVADLACGTCLLSRILFARKANLAICGIDLSEEQIEIARREFEGKNILAASLENWRDEADHEKAAVYLRTGSADQLPFEDGEIDLVVIGNAIHLMPNKEKFLQEVARVLRPQGRFAFNSVFFAGTFPPSSEPIYTDWMKQAVLVLEERNSALRKAGKPAIKRIRGRGDKAFSKGWLSEEGWSDMLSRTGFTRIESSKREVPISKSGLELVAAYGGLAEVLMSGYPVEVASECLHEAVGRTFSRFMIDQVPRYWLEVKAVRKPAS